MSASNTNFMPIQETAISATPHKDAAAARFYRPELDALRFFAFLGVFVFHVVPHDAASYLSHPVFPASLVPIVRAISASGAFGVDLFFALSAYLITNLLIREEARRGYIDVKAFYVRRILRIWPLYFFMIGFAAIVQLWDKNQHFDWQYIVGYLLLAGNWVFVLKGLPHTIANPLWSVSIEEQFYLIWPLALRRMSRRLLVLAAILLLALANGVRVYLVFTHALGGSIEYNTFTRIDSIALGILVAYLFGTEAPSLRLLSRIALIILCLTTWFLVGYFADLNSQDQVAPFWGTLIGRPLVALASCGLLVAFLGAPDAGLRAFTSPFLTYLGRISYGLYVFHSAGLLFASHLFLAGTVTLKSHAIFAVTGFFFTLLFSMVSYRWLETPFLRIKEKFAVVKSRPV